MTAEEIRTIVREEIREALKVLQSAADRYPGYETDTIGDGAARMLESVAGSTADRLRHGSGCPVRVNDAYYWDCNCGADDSK
ncbi:hypothetical protein ABT096_29515 [Streptomyces sp. NPDC002561]|uniref:hypothetical protein n=1 Tax=Streptomyces sp. NPDC002561 TaxID=3154418 RepID=UPI0033264DF2